MEVYYAIAFKHECGTIGFYSDFSREIHFSTMDNAKKHAKWVNKQNKTDKYFLRVFYRFEDIGAK